MASYGKLVPVRLRIEGIWFEVDGDAVHELIGSYRHPVREPRRLAVVHAALERRRRKDEYDRYVMLKALGRWPEDRPAPPAPEPVPPLPPRRRLRISRKGRRDG